MNNRVLVTGGAGYVGSVVVPRLLEDGYAVRVLDLCIFGEDSLRSVASNPNFALIKGDIRDRSLVRSAVDGCDSVLHLACISNDPSVELDPALSRSINFDAFKSLITISAELMVRRFIFASSGSVYGVSDSPNVGEDHPRVPISLYNKYKAMCEDELLALDAPDMEWVIVRPATICGYSPRQRLDLTVNILTNHAVNRGIITVFGGNQMRPNLHMNDMVDLYMMLLKLHREKIDRKIFNAAYQNNTVSEIAHIVQDVVSIECPHIARVGIETKSSDDLRSYHVSSKRIELELGFRPKRTIQDGARDLIRAFKSGLLPGSLDDERYFNVKLMKSKGLK